MTWLGDGGGGFGGGSQPTALLNNFLLTISLCVRGMTLDHVLKISRSQLTRTLHTHTTHTITPNSNRSDNNATAVALAAARPLRPNETRIDYFLSHSWHDDPDAKSNAIDAVKEQFRSRNSDGEDPTFWIDKVNTHEA